MLSSHRFLCPCRIVLASPDDCVTCLYHFSLRLFTEFRRSSYDPMAFPFLAFTSLLVVWSLYKIPRSLRNISSPMPVSFFQCLLLWSTFHMHTQIWTWPGKASVWSLSWWRCSCRSICLSLVTAAVVWAVLDSTSGLDPSSDTIAPRYSYGWSPVDQFMTVKSILTYQDSFRNRTAANLYPQGMHLYFLTKDLSCLIQGICSVYRTITTELNSLWLSGQSTKTKSMYVQINIH